MMMNEEEIRVSKAGVSIRDSQACLRDNCKSVHLQNNIKHEVEEELNSRERKMFE